MTGTSPRITVENVGDYYLDESGSVWRCVGYCEHPTATLEAVGHALAGITDPPRRSGAVGAPVFFGFRRLVPEERG